MSIYGPEDPAELTAGAATKTYVDARDAALEDYVDTHVEKAGDTMTGNLNMGGNLVRGLPTSPKLYEGDEAVSWAQAITLVVDAADTWVNKDGDTMTGDLNMGSKLMKGLPTAPVDGTYTGEEALSLAQINAVVSDAVGNYVAKAGDTMTGNLINQGTTLSQTGVSIAHPGGLAVGRSVAESEIDIQQDNYNDFSSLEGGIKIRNFDGTRCYQLGWDGEDLLGLFHSSGGVISRACSFTRDHIVNIRDPIEDNQAANKRYVDSRTTHPYLYAPSVRSYNDLGSNTADIGWNFNSFNGFSTSDNIHIRIDSPGVSTALVAFRTTTASSYARLYVYLNDSPVADLVIPTSSSLIFPCLWTGYCNVGDIIHIRGTSLNLALNNSNNTNFTLYRLST